MGFNNRSHNSQEAGSNKKAANASVFGEAFHNPYTFIPFPKQGSDRYAPTSLSIDEQIEEKDRYFSGVLELDITTRSPLMSCEAVGNGQKGEHQTYRALTIDNDVIVPATGVRGALRTLLTILTGGSLGYLDDTIWLTQNRDAKLGPNKKDDKIPDQVFLGKVIKPGSLLKPGTIELGETKLETVEYLSKKIPSLDNKRPNSDGSNPIKLSDGREVKLSGRPVNRKGKKEGTFKGNGEIIELSETYWSDYQGRHKNSIRPILKKGDLVWLEPSDVNCTKINSATDIESLQWARWGRKGEKLQNLLPPHVLPDSMSNQNGVDWVTDLFGQIPISKEASGPFASKIRIGNLIFKDAAKKVTQETLAPLAAPKPGCIAFYRDQDDLDQIDSQSPLKGYKVYRNTIERGEQAPWKFTTQGVYQEKGELKDAKQKMNKTAELLNEGVTGQLKISFRSLTQEDLYLLYTAFSVDWKLGGGKPLGLGHTRVTNIKYTDEAGEISYPMQQCESFENLQLSREENEYFIGYANQYIENFEHRIDLYKESQKPVEKLRYPRAVDKNNNKSSKAGLSWFARHAIPKKTTGKGLETFWTEGKLKTKASNSQIKAQALPNLTVGNSKKDQLYGYDLVQVQVKKSNNKNLVDLAPFDAAKHTTINEKSGYNTSQNRDSRQQHKQTRGEPTEAKTLTENTATANTGNEWLDSKLTELSKQHHAPINDIWGGKALAQEWQKISEQKDKNAVFEIIKSYWQAQKWWDDTPKGAKRKAKAIYEEK